ncbi:hypothetical protein HYH03_015938 [Edaphochlamys debaryana]|uniref:Uncharacterized protein n=1 Tax=Edaphochlamys debaryana TaxID=47281 RepID=A0A836BRW8_9CHLO|nr:hypothetical protein HYH03_015938 [Edaphochlamys debaryana]|eukprot:KAG2485259.1 hypothetical protein HYH03_015938 [Edaphochlamys debaryana]
MQQVDPFVTRGSVASMRPHPRVYLLLLALLISWSSPALSKGAVRTGGSSGTGTHYVGSSGSTAAGSRGTVRGTTITGTSYGATSRGRVVVASGAVFFVLWYGHSYPAVTLTYQGYEDDCALRNVTVLPGESDAPTDLATVNALPQYFANDTGYDALNASAGFDAFNASVVARSNGSLVLDPAFCNTSTLVQAEPTSGEPGGAAGRDPRRTLLRRAAAAAAAALLVTWLQAQVLAG